MPARSLLLVLLVVTVIDVAAEEDALHKAFHLRRALHAKFGIVHQKVQIGMLPSAQLDWLLKEASDLGAQAVDANSLFVLERDLFRRGLSALSEDFHYVFVGSFALSKDGISTIFEPFLAFKRMGLPASIVDAVSGASLDYSVSLLKADLLKLHASTPKAMVASFLSHLECDRTFSFQDCHRTRRWGRLDCAPAGSKRSGFCWANCWTRHDTESARWINRCQ